MSENLQEKAQGFLKNQSLMQVALAKNIPAGSYVFKQGDTDDHFYVVLSGTLEISVQASDGSQKVMAAIKPGELLGEGIFSGKTTKPASARALSEVSLLSLSHADFEKLQSSDPMAATEFLLGVLALVNGRLRLANVKLLALFEINQMLHQYRDDLKGLSSALIQRLLGLIKSADGALMLQNPFDHTYRTVYSTKTDLNESILTDVDPKKAQCVTRAAGHFILCNLNHFGVIALLRPITEEAFDDDDLRLVQLVSEQVAVTLEEASLRAEEKARNLLHQKRYSL